MSSEPQANPTTVEPARKRWMDGHQKDVNKLFAIHRFRRPDLSISEDGFIQKFILPLGVKWDDYANYYKLIGPTKPRIMWSAHTDTVHNMPGIQEVSAWGNKGENKSTLRLASVEKVSNCLGADDGAGVWMLTELIKAKVPGLYIFHRNEERGGKGARFILQNHRDVIEGIQAAIAFDRRGKRDIITHQCGFRTCSEVFARSLASGLAMNHAPDDGGTFTDTEVYSKLIPECTNIAAGYEHAHTSREELDLDYLIQLRDAVLKLDLNKLIISRDPSISERKTFVYNNKRWKGNEGWENDHYGGHSKHGFNGKKFDDYTPPAKEPTTVLDYVRQNPDAIASMLEEWGVDLKNLKDYVEATTKALPGPAKSEDNPGSAPSGQA